MREPSEDDAAFDCWNHLDISAEEWEDEAWDEFCIDGDLDPENLLDLLDSNEN